MTGHNLRLIPFILSWLNQVYLTDLSTRESILLCKEEHPVLGLALQVDEWLWAATTDSSLHKWPARERSATKTLQRTSSFVAGLLPFARARANIDGSAPVRYTIPFRKPLICLNFFIILRCVGISVFLFECFTV